MFLKLLITVMKFFCYACIGIAMSAVILFPVLRQFFETSRMDAEQMYPLFYQFSYYKNFPVRFLIPWIRDQWTVLGFTASALLAVIILFCKKKQHVELKVSFLIMTAMLLIPFLGRALNGFSYVANRWCFIYAALVSYILVTVWQDMTEPENISPLAVLASAGYLCYIFMAGESKKESFYYGILFLLPAVLWIFLAWKKSSNKEPRNFRLSGVLFSGILILNICVNWFNVYSSMEKNKVAEFIDSGTAMGRVLSTAPYAIRQASAEEEEFFRFEADDFIIANTAVLAKVNGIQYFWSLENGAISDYLLDMAQCRLFTFNYKDLDHRTFLNVLSSVKYFAQKDSDFLPFGYELKEIVSPGMGSYALYENQYALPLGYTYKYQIPYESYRNMRPAQRQEALLQGIVLEDDEPSAKEIPVTEPVFTSRKLAYSVSCDENVIQEPDGSFHVKKKGGTAELSFSGLKNSETYLWLQGMEITGENRNKAEFILEISSDESHNNMKYVTPYYKFYAGQKDFLVNLGYHNMPQSIIRIRFPKKGRYRFEEMQVVCQPMENYVCQTEALREYTMENEQITTNRVEGTIHLPEKRILCLSIPYTKGWSAYVDGKKTPLLKANVMYMALPLEEGEHKIVLSYRTPGLFAGILVSCVGFLLFVFFVWRRKRG